MKMLQSSQEALGPSALPQLRPRGKGLAVDTPLPIPQEVHSHWHEPVDKGEWPQAAVPLSWDVKWKLVLVAHCIGCPCKNGLSHRIESSVKNKINTLRHLEGSEANTNGFCSRIRISRVPKPAVVSRKESWIKPGFHDCERMKLY